MIRVADAGSLVKMKKVSDWFYRTLWKPTLSLPVNAGNDPKTMLVFCDNYGLAKKLEMYLHSSELPCIFVQMGEVYKKQNENTYQLNPADEKDFEQLLYDIKSQNITP